MVSLFCVTAVDLGLTGRGCWRPPARESVMVIAPVHNPPRPLLSFPAPTPHAPPFKSHPHCLRHGVDWINSYDEKWRARASGGKRKKATASLWLCFSRMPLFHSLSPPHQHTHTHTYTHTCTHTLHMCELHFSICRLTEQNVFPCADHHQGFLPLPIWTHIFNFLTLSNSKQTVAQSSARIA